MLLAPVLGLGLFAVLPVLLATPLYLIILGTSIFLYRAIHQAHMIPPQGGPDSILGSIARVSCAVPGRLVVALHGEYWTADLTDAEGRPTSSPPVLVEGAHVQVVGRRSTRLMVSPVRKSP